MLKKFADGFFRSAAGIPSDAQRRRHAEEKHERDCWRHDVDELRVVIARLSAAYSQHKGDFALGRYEELKRMIKTAVTEYNLVVSEQRNRRTLPTSSGAAGKKSHGVERGVTGVDRGAAKGTGKTAVLKDDVQRLCEVEASAEISSDDMEADMTRLRREVLQLKQDFRRERDKLQKLESDYATLKNANPAQRYMELKELIKDCCS